MTSKVYFESINGVKTMVTAQRKDNDAYGNPQYRVQIWLLDDNGQGHLWYPKVPGYRQNKNQYYNIQAYDLDKAVRSFLNALPL